MESLMSSSKWLLMASTDTDIVVSYTETNPINIYKVVAKWILKGSANKFLKSLWDNNIDKDDVDFENALVEQLETQAESKPDDPQTVTFKTLNRFVDITVETRGSNKKDGKVCRFPDCTEEYIKFNIIFSIYMRLSSLKKSLKIETNNIEFIVYNISTPIKYFDSKKIKHENTGYKKVEKRSSKISVEDNE